MKPRKPRKTRKTRKDSERQISFPCSSVSSVVLHFSPSERLQVLAGRLLVVWLLGVVVVSNAHAQTFVPAERFVGMLADGTRIKADLIKEWHDDTAKPQLAGHAILDPRKPARWIIDQSVPLAEVPVAYVEFFGGDRLPCRVVDYRRSLTWSYETLGEYLVVEPLVEVDFPSRPTTPYLRVSTRWLKRIVFGKRAGVPAGWHPGTVFLHDGSRVSYRVVRWSGSGLSVLTDSGVRTLLYSQVAELHLPGSNDWDAYFEQLAVLTPDLTARIIQAETSQGVRITVSTERFSAKHSGDKTKSENWYPLFHPAWSLDPITIPFRTIRSLRFFSPEQPPMSLFEPSTTRTEPVFSAGWNWKSNLSVQSGVLRNNELFAGWGFGVHAPTTLAFPLHSVVRQVRAFVGLDQLVGHGGCTQAMMSLQSRPTAPFYKSAILVGNKTAADSGWKNVTVAAGKSDSLLLIADPVINGRPKGADPFDVRDCLDWLEPEWKLDKVQLGLEVASRIPGSVTVLDGWTNSPHLYSQLSDTDLVAVNAAAAKAAAASTAAGASVQSGLLVKNAWDRTVPEDERLRLLIKPAGEFVVFSQQKLIEKPHRWLSLSVSKPADSTDAATIIVRVDGRALREIDVPVRTNRQDPDPIIVPVSEFQGRKSLIEIVLLSAGEKSFVDWRGAVLSEHPPGITPLFDETGDLIAHLRDGEGELSLTTTEPHHGLQALKLTGGNRSSANLPGFDFAVREYPNLGEYRYLRFVWKKATGTRIGFQLAYDGSIGIPENAAGRLRPRAFRDGAARAALRRQNSNPRRPVSGASRGMQFGYQYDAGTGDPVESVMRLDRKLPAKWTLVGRDLFGEFGSFNVTGMGFQSCDYEPAFFDQIYLARLQSDFNWIDEVSGVAKPPPSDDPNILGQASMERRYGGLISSIAPQFSTRAVGEPVQLLGEHQGREKVFRTLPPSKEKACLLKAPVSVRKGKKTVLKISAGRHPEGDWQLIVRVAGKELYRSMVDATTAKEGWLDHDVDLSGFAGKDIVVEVANEATGWSYEHGFWNRLEVVEQ
jgi:hypothetical protein